MKTGMWRGMLSILCILLGMLIGTTAVMNEFSGAINDKLGISSGTIAASSTVFQSSYGELSDANLKKLMADELAYSIREMEESTVLLKNNGVLPIDKNLKVTLFGRASVNPIGGGGVNFENATSPTVWADALKAAGYSVNETLLNAYAGSATKRKVGDSASTQTANSVDIGEEASSFYTAELKQSFQQYHDAAIVLLSRGAGEGKDLLTEDKEGISQLALHKNEKDLLEMIRTEGFDKVIVLLNSVYPMETYEIEPYADAVLWIGNPGLKGWPGIVNILSGDANPSGRLVMTWATDSLSSPAIQNWGDYSFAGNEDKYVVYAEGIYFGYRYYETRYEDCVLKSGNADGSKGVYASNDKQHWNYADEVSYPFGYGLSYSTFEQTLIDGQYNAASDTFTFTVNVKNTGDRAGKNVVQVYVQSPYTQYDRENLVEKASVQLVGFAKTDLLEPGAEQTVSVSVDRYLTASYDANGAKGYILDAGDYLFAIGGDCHDALNNILAKKGADGLVNPQGVAVVGNPDKVWCYTIDTMDTESYRNSEYTGNEITNCFDDVDINYFYDAPVVTYLSRQDWEGTYPETARLSINDKLKSALDTVSLYDRYIGEKLNVSDVPHGIDQGIAYADMIGVPKDDPKWDAFIQQMTVEDLAVSPSDSYGSKAVASVGKPAITNSEGPTGCSTRYKFGEKERCTPYASGPNRCATFSTEIWSNFGSFFAEDCMYAGISAVMGIGADMVRSPFGGRTAEYLSEDGNLNYLIAEPVYTTMLAKGMIGCMKHLCLNDQETNRGGIATFVNEQTIRQHSLRAWEGAITKGGSLGLMSSYNRIGCYYTNCSKPLLTDLLRGEWGFKGFAITDGVFETDKRVTAVNLLAGSDMFCLNNRTKSIIALVNENNDGALLKKLQEVNKNIFYAYAQSNLANSLSKTEKVVEADMTWWQIGMIALDACIGLAIIFTVAMLVKNSVFTGKGKKNEPNNE